MTEKLDRPTAEELAELTAYLTARQHEAQPEPGEAGFPSGLAGELLKLAESNDPDPAFAARLELQLRQAAEAGASSLRPGWLTALWKSFTQSKRKTPMKRLIAFALTGIILLALLWVSIPLLVPFPVQTQVALATPPTQTQAPTPQTPLTPTVIPATPQPPVAINFTPQPLPVQPPILPSLEQLYGGIGGGGGGNLPEGIPLNLATELPAGPAEVTAYYRLENTPLTLDQDSQIAAQWGLNAKIYLPLWMQSLSPDQIERSYYAIDGMQILSMWNGELSYTNLAIFPNYGGHQDPQTGLPPAEQAQAIAVQYLSQRSLLNYPYQTDLRMYNYGQVGFYRLLENLRLDTPAAWVKIDPQGQVGAAVVTQEDYQAIGTYPVISAQAAWDMLVAGQPKEQMRISYYPAQDGNPQYWGRIYPVGQTAHLFGAPTFFIAAETGAMPYVQLNNLVLVGDVSGLVEYLQSNQGYIHAWGEVQEVNGTRQLQLAGWEPFDEFSGYFDGTVRRTTDSDFLELSDGWRLSLPNLPADVPADIPLYAEGGLVGDTLEWFILQVHPASEGQMPPDLSQAQAVIDQVELVYLSPGLNNLPPENALDPAYRMLVPAWRFSGHVTNANGTDMIFQAYIQATSNP